VAYLNASPLVPLVSRPFINAMFSS
jgi:hypothetical protein